MRSGYWKADWFLGLAVVILFALLNWMSDLLPGLERKAYDLALQSASRTLSDKVAIIAIDQAKARAVGYLVFFVEPENERSNRTHGESMAQLMFRNANEPPAPIASFGEIPEGLVRFLERALAKNPDERYQTGEHVGGALRAAVPAAAAAAKVDLEI